MSSRKAKTTIPMQSAATDLEQSLSYVCALSIAEASPLGKHIFGGRWSICDT